MKIITLRNTPYKEKDGILDVVSEDGLCSFLVKGLYSEKSKNRGLINALTIAEIEFADGNFKNRVLKSAEISYTPVKANNEYDYMVLLMIVQEVTLRLLQGDEAKQIFTSLEKTINKIKDTKNPYFITLRYLFSVFGASGYKFDPSSCVFCATKHNLITFSFNDGGFACRDCVNKSDIIFPKFNNNQLYAIHDAILQKEQTNALNREEFIEFLTIINEFIKDNYGVNLNSLVLMK